MNHYFFYVMIANRPACVSAYIPCSLDVECLLYSQYTCEAKLVYIKGLFCRVSLIGDNKKKTPKKNSLLVFLKKTDDGC